MNNNYTNNRYIRLILIEIIGFILLQVILPVSENFDIQLLRFIVMAIFGYTIFRGLDEGNILNPWFLFALTPLSLLLYSAEISTYYLEELTAETFGICILNFAGFLVGLSISQRFIIKSSHSDGEPHLLEDEKERYGLDSIILLILGELPVLCSYFGISFPFGSILRLLSYISVAMAIKEKKYIRMLIYVCVIILLSVLTSFNKSIFLSICLVIAVSFEKYSSSPNIRRKLVIWLAVALLLMIVVAFPLKDYLGTDSTIAGFLSEDLDTTAQYYSQRTNWSGNSLLLMPYLYLVQGWNNLQYVMQTQAAHTYGLWMLKPIIGWLQLDDGIAAYSALQPYSSFNTYTFITVNWVDFGYVLSIIPSIFLGIYVGKIYNYYLKSNSPYAVYCYALNAAAVFEMFFSNHFFQQSYPFTVLLLSVMCVFISRRVTLSGRIEYYSDE